MIKIIEHKEFVLFSHFQSDKWCPNSVLIVGSSGDDGDAGGDGGGGGGGEKNKW